jgi:hypothetical protein
MNKYPDAIDVYIDDIFIKTGLDLELHREIVHKVLNLLEKESFLLKPSKCKFEQLALITWAYALRRESFASTPPREMA